MTELSRDGWAFTELLVEVFRINGLLLAAGDELARPAGLTSARWQVLGVIDHGPATVAQVARTMGLTRQSVQQTTDALVHDRLVARTTNPADRRAKLLTLTPTGHTALRHVEEKQSTWANAIAEQLPNAQLRTCLAVLHDLGHLLKEKPRGE